MARTIEYKETIILSRKNLDVLVEAQKYIRREGILNNDEYTLAEKLAGIVGGTATILGLAFVTSTPIGIAAGVTSVMLTLSTSAIVDLDDLLTKGISDLGDLETWYKDYPDYDLIEVEMGFLEYPDQEIRFVTHTSPKYIKRIHVDGGWHLN